MSNSIILRVNALDWWRALAFAMTMLLAIVYPSSVNAQVSAGRFYAGAGVNFSQYLVEYKFGSPATNEAGRWQPIAGYYLTSRLALQIGYSGGSASYYGVAEGTMLNGDRTQAITSTANSFRALPLLARYTLTRKPSKRLQFDLLGGVTFARGEYDGAFSETLNGQTVQATSEHFDISHTYLTAGVAARYVFSRHWELEATYMMNRNLKRMPNYYSELVGARWGLTSGYGLNVRYRFNVGQPKQPVE